MEHQRLRGPATREDSSPILLQDVGHPSGASQHGEREVDGYGRKLLPNRLLGAEPACRGWRRRTPGQGPQSTCGAERVDPQQAPTPFPQFKDAPTVVEVVAWPALGTAGPGYHQVEALGNPQVDGVNRR